MFRPWAVYLGPWEPIEKCENPAHPMVRLFSKNSPWAGLGWDGMGWDGFSPAHPEPWRALHPSHLHHKRLQCPLYDMMRRAPEYLDWSQTSLNNIKEKRVFLADKDIFILSETFNVSNMICVIFSRFWLGLEEVSVRKTGRAFGSTRSW